MNWTAELFQEYEHVRKTMPDKAPNYLILINSELNRLNNDQTTVFSQTNTELVNELIWRSPAFEKEETHLVNEMHNQRYPAMVKDGPLCPNKACPHRNNTITIFIQTRSADEPETVFNQCRSCNRKWS